MSSTAQSPPSSSLLRPPPMIGPAKAEDAPSIKRIVDAAYSKYIEPMGMIPAAMLVHYDELIQNTQTVYVLRLDGEVMGAVIIAQDEPSASPPSSPPLSLPAPATNAVAPAAAETHKENETNSLMISNLVVAPEAQHRGYGRLLMQYAESHARSHNLSALTLYANEKMTENIAWYTKIGFVETGRRTVDGFKRVYFRKGVV